MAAAKSGGLRARLRKMVLRDEAEGGARPGGGHNDNGIVMTLYRRPPRAWANWL